MRNFLALAILSVLAATVVAADNWTSFRGSNGDGISTTKNLPLRWSESENILWKTATHGKGWSSPVIWGDRIWLTTADEIKRDKPAPVPKSGGAKGSVELVTFFATCFDAKTGRVVHDIKLGEERDPAFCIDFNSYASPTPVVEENRIYANFGSHGTWCLDGDGKILWERRDLRCDHFRGPGSSPIVFGDLLFMIFDGFDQQYVIALDKKTGSTRWKQDRNIRYATDNGDYKKAYATPQVIEVAGKPQLICPSAECTIAYEPETGTELWRFAHLKKQTMNAAARPIAGNGLTYLISGYPAQLYALRQSVSGTVTKDSVAWETDKGVPTRPSLLLQGNLLFMVSDGGVLSCLDAATGKQYWQERLNGEFTASPILAGGYIFLPNQTGKTIVVKAQKEYEPVATNLLDAGCMASPAVTGDSLILRTKTHLYCIGRK